MRFRRFVVSLCNTTQPPLIMVLLCVFRLPFLTPRLWFWDFEGSSHLLATLPFSGFSSSSDGTDTFHCFGVTSSPLGSARV